MSTPTLAVLKTELTTDPKALGYATLKLQTNGPEAVAARINELNTVPADTIFKSYVPVEELLAELQWAEFTAWSAAVKTGLDQYFRGTRIKTGSATLRASLAAMLPASTSKTNMVALATKTASRAEFLWGEGTTISAQDVSLAYELP